MIYLLFKWTAVMTEKIHPISPYETARVGWVGELQTYNCNAWHPLLEVHLLTCYNFKTTQNINLSNLHVHWAVVSTTMISAIIVDRQAGSVCIIFSQWKRCIRNPGIHSPLHAIKKLYLMLKLIQLLSVRRLNKPIRLHISLADFLL